MDKLIPLVNIYTYHNLKEQQSFDPQKDISMHSKYKVTEFAEVFIKNIESLYMNLQGDIVSSEFRVKQI